MRCIHSLCTFLSGYSLYKPLPLFEIIEVFYSPMNLIFGTQMITYDMLRKSQPCWELSIFFIPLLLCLSIQKFVLLLPSPIKSSSSLWTSKIGSLNGLNIKRKPRKGLPILFLGIYFFLEISPNLSQTQQTDNRQKDIRLVPEHKDGLT